MPSTISSSMASSFSAIPRPLLSHDDYDRVLSPSLRSGARVPSAAAALGVGLSAASVRPGISISGIGAGHWRSFGLGCSSADADRNEVDVTRRRRVDMQSWEHIWENALAATASTARASV